mmetsp:Transcript_13080/g.23531  ORF Transcript_13080/g.23531 Transcript_13080/m.23531 type:complete len:105 (-) Transcript_13080:1994-2308(-)
MAFVLSFCGFQGALIYGSKLTSKCGSFHSIPVRRHVRVDSIVSMNAEKDKKQEVLDSPVPEEKDPFVRLAMRNMVYQAPKSVQHFGLTFIALLAFFVGMAYLTK